MVAKSQVEFNEALIYFCLNFMGKGDHLALHAFSLHSNCCISGYSNYRREVYVILGGRQRQHYFHSFLFTQIQLLAVSNNRRRQGAD